MLNDIKNKLGDKNKKDVFDKLKNGISKVGDKLKNLLDNKMKKKCKDLKIVDREDKLENLINDHNDKFNEDAKQDFIDKLKDIYRKKDMKDALKKWKDVNDDQKNRNKIFDKLIRHKLNELRKKEDVGKNILMITNGMNDVMILNYCLIKKKKIKFSYKDSQIFISSQNDINISTQPPRMSPIPSRNKIFPYSKGIK